MLKVVYIFKSVQSTPDLVNILLLTKKFTKLGVDCNANSTYNFNNITV